MRTARLLALAAGCALSVPLLLPADAATSPSFRRVVLQDQGAYGEPSVAVADDGRHVVVCVPGGAGSTSVWWSENGGRSFRPSHTNALNGGGDCEVDFLPDGTLINADLEVVDSAIRVSKDFGRTWQGQETAGIEQDRQWLAHSKDGKTVYLVYHDFVLEGEFYAQSNDGGLTWPPELAAQPVTGPDQVALPGLGAGRPGTPASLVDQGVNTYSGPMLISPDGKDMYVLYSISDATHNVTDGTPPFGHSRGIVVAHRGPEQTLFTNNYAVANDGSSIAGAIFPWGAIDQAGTVYVFYNSDKGSLGHLHTYYVYSKDKAATWSKPVRVDDAPLTRGAQIYATGDAGAPGVIDIAWYGHRGLGGADDLSALWSVHFAQVRGADTTHPRITRALVSDPKRPIHKGDICLNGLLCSLAGDRSLLDFFELQIGRDGLAHIAYAANYGYGFDTAGLLSGGGPKGRVVYAKQIAGRSAWQR